MVNTTPIKITFYNPDDSIKKEYSKVRIPVGLVDVALELSEHLDQETDQETWQALQAFLVEAFGNQFTLDELKQGADLGDMQSVFKMILTKVAAVMADIGAENPTVPGKQIPGRGSVQRRH
jgi:hypothetical protein